MKLIASYKLEALFDSGAPLVSTILMTSNSILRMKEIIMAPIHSLWKPWQVDTSKLKEEKRSTSIRKGKASRSDVAQSVATQEAKRQAIADEKPAWIEYGNAPSRGPRGYDGETTNDSLFTAGGSRQIPTRLRHLAGGGGGGNNDEKNIDDGSGSSGGGGGEDGGGGNREGNGSFLALISAHGL